MNLGLSTDYLIPLVCLHVIVSACMTGVVWSMHTIHYPLMRRVPPERFAAFMEEHLSRFTRWVLPLMVLEFVTALALVLFNCPASLGNLFVLCGAWCVTFYLRPIYQQLSEGHKPELLERLIRLNRYRTILWLTHLAVATYIAIVIITIN